MMKMSFSQTPDMSVVQEFVYQSVFSAEGTPDVPIDLSIFERVPTSVSRSHPGTPNVSDLELKKRETTAYERGLADARREMQAEVDRAAATARETLLESLKVFEN